MSDTQIRIAMWSGPRNISTAMMRSFGSRGDCVVVDEPFYGAFLKDTGEPQPMAEDVIASMDCDWERIAESLRGPIPDGKQIWYQKHMPHHMVGSIGISDFPDHRHAFLIRDPHAVVASYAAKRVKVTPADLGYERQLSYFEQLAACLEEVPAVVDSADILENPEGYLCALCTKLQIDWDLNMLNWPAGRRNTDGIWGTHWYNRVVETTGFGQSSGKAPQLTAEETAVAEQCLPFYEKLKKYRLKPA